MKKAMIVTLVVLAAWITASGLSSPPPFVSASGVDETRRRIGALAEDDHWWSANGKAMAWNNKNLHRLFPTVNVYREGPVRELAYDLNPAVAGFQVEGTDGKQSFVDFLYSDRSTTMGVVMASGVDCPEQYEPRDSCYMLYSASIGEVHWDESSPNS